MACEMENAHSERVGVFDCTPSMGVAVRRGLKEAGGKPATRGTQTRYEAVRSDEWARYHEVIKGQNGKLGECAEKVNVLR